MIKDMKKIMIWMLVPALLLGCGKQSAEDFISGEMQFAPERASLTRANDGGFQKGDVIGVYVTHYTGQEAPALQLGGNYASNAALTFDGSAWTCDPKLYWEDGKFNVYAYYPRSSVSSVDEYPFQVALDQREAASGTQLSAWERSDFLWASNFGLTRTAQVPLVFNHRMSRVDIHLVKGEDYEGDIPDNAVVYIHNTVTDALIDLATGDVLKAPRGTAHTVTARQLGTGRYAALIVPQMLTHRVPLIEIICGDVSYLLESKFQFKSGVRHTLNITLTDNPERVRIDIGGEIVGWD